ncbi:hypothetical protein GH714_040912 [Hevea brasiliensis]|uniref:ATP synthase subunit gamma, mitochondrial n=1 Tax=Hevea brasiliensis TaxID=3981 RepID=A0A6A6MLG7_HEVBR|nr:hypothetical protein GH714_040912 [Hevea brasiliensis]
MAMAALRREGRRFAAPLISSQPITAMRSSLIAEEQAPLGIRSISTQVVRNRMKSVKNIQKITKAMKMVAASKLRAIQTRAENSRGLWQPFTALLGDAPSVDAKKNVIVTISSDKGLCGGINSTSVKISKAIHKLTAGPEKETKYVILGEKAKAQLIRDSKKDIELSITELQKNPLNYTQVSVLADDILKNVEYDALRIVFNKFHSVVSFLPTMSTILSPEVVEREAESGGKLGDLDSYEIEGGETKGEILQNLAEFQFSCVLFNAVLENACSEQGARMSAMDSSSRNAGEMLDRLTLTYNRTRQASITTELIEIISGASALEDYLMEGLVHLRIDPIHPTCRHSGSRFIPVFPLQLKKDLNRGGIMFMKPQSFISDIASVQPLKASSLGHFHNAVPSKDVLGLWRSVDAVCLDVDSTVCLDESIDELAEFCGAGKAVAEWTAKVMGGSVPFEEALAARLSLFKPSLSQFRAKVVHDLMFNLSVLQILGVCRFSLIMLSRLPDNRISPGIDELVKKLKAKNTNVYLISGGFRQMINPVASILGIPPENIFANQLLFGSLGEFLGFDANEPTSRSGGKATAVQQIRKVHGYKALVMIGDGATDLEARKPGGANLFICYAGVQLRQTVAAKADCIIPYDLALTEAARKAMIILDQSSVQYMLGDSHRITILFFRPVQLAFVLVNMRLESPSRAFQVGAWPLLRFV